MKTINDIIWLVQTQNLLNKFTAVTVESQEIFARYTNVTYIQDKINSIQQRREVNFLISIPYITYDDVDECLNFHVDRFKKTINGMQWVSEQSRVKWVKTINNEYSLMYTSENFLLGGVMQRMLPVIEKNI